MLLKTKPEAKEFDATTVLKMACYGSVVVGNSADLVFIDINDVKFLPLVKTDKFDNYAHNIMMNGSDSQVMHVMVSGKWLLKSKKLTHLNEAEVNNKYKSIIRKIFNNKSEL